MTLLIFLLNYCLSVQPVIATPPRATPALAYPAVSDSSAVPAAQPVTCNCEITQGGVSYPINALQGTVSATAFYSYGVPNGACANTGLELGNALVLFLYEDINTGIVSIFLIADIANDGSGGSMEFELSCLPSTSYVVVQDDPGEFGGSPPIIAGNWSWGTCCTDGGVVENLGCGSSLNVDLLAASGVDSIVWLTGDIANPTQLLMSTGGEVITIDCGGPVCCPIGFDTDIMVTDAGCPGSEDGAIDLEPEDGTPPYTFDWSNGETTADISGLAPGVYEVTITDANDCTEELVITVDYVTDAPAAELAQLEVCSDAGEGLFNLTTIITAINGGSGDGVFFFENQDLTGPIADPENYLSGTATIYAVTDNGFCYSEPVPIDLVVNLIPIGSPAAMDLCEESNGIAIFDLTTLDNTVSGGAGSVQWFEDLLLTGPINEAYAYASGSTIVYAVVDDGQCLSEPIPVTLTVFTRPVGNPAEAFACGDGNDEAVFDLTALESGILNGVGSVDWFYEINLFDQIPNPTNFQTVTTTVFAVIFDGDCYSDPIPVELTVDPTPVAIPWTINACDNGLGMAWFDLWAYEDSIGGQNGVDWYLDEFLSEPIVNPGSFLTESTVIYATAYDDFCVSQPVEVILNVVPGPPGNPTSLESCADSTGLGLFDLTTIEAFVSGGMGTVTWFSDPQATIPLPWPDSVSTPVSMTVYAVVTLGDCVSLPVPVDLVIISAVIAMPATWSECDNGNGTAVFNLTLIDALVSMGSGQVTWYLDPAGMMPIAMPGSFASGDSTVYAQVTAGACSSDIVPVMLDAVPIPAAIDLFPQVCGDTDGMTLVDLTQWDAGVSAGTGAVAWHADAAHAVPVIRPDSILTGDTVFYAVVTAAGCSNTATLTLDVLAGPLAHPASLEVCALPGQTIPVDLTAVNDSIMGTPGTVQWFVDPAGAIPVPDPSAFPMNASDTLFAVLSDGLCLSDPVTVAVVVFEQPVANGATLLGCADTAAYAVFNLTQADFLVSGGTGQVMWFGDDGLQSPIAMPDAFPSGDSTIYALVTNAICTAGPVPVVLSVTDSLVANPVDLRLCVESSDVATIDLTALDPQVSGGSGQVSWFADSLAMVPIPDPANFTTGGDTLYAIITQGGCVSVPAPVTIGVVRADPPLPQCVFTAIDSVAFAWNDVAPAYTLSYWVDGIPISAGISWIGTSWGLGGLGQGVTVSLVVSALADSACAGPLVGTTTCITDICPTVDIAFPGLDSVYCRDVGSILLDPQPPGGKLSGPGVSGNTLIPAQVPGSMTTIRYDWLDITTGCTYADEVTVRLVDPPVPPDVTCSSAELYAVPFAWTGSGPFGYVYAVNGGMPSTETITTDTEVVVSVPNEGDAVSLWIWSLGAAPCANSDTILVTCNARTCPPATISLDDPGILCSNDPPVQLGVTISELTGMYSVTWNGPGIIDPSGVYDPGASTSGTTVLVTVEQDGCIYQAAFDITVQPQPSASFEILGTPCVNQLLDVIFTGSASSSAMFAWDLDGADTMAAAPPALFAITWPEAGDYRVQLIVTDNGCPSEARAVPITIDAPLPVPEPQCEVEDYYTVTVSWPPVPGATGYQVSASAGRVSVAGTTCTIHQLDDDTPVTISVTATGPTACGPSTSTIECRTIPYIPPLTYVPTVFSPNGDGVNDVFFVQANEEIVAVSAMRVFDRWGDVLFEKFDALPNDPDAGWDGTFHGQSMNPDVFVYWIEVVTLKGQTITLTGDVTILR